MSAAADRLAKTRLAIIEHVHRREHRHEGSEARRERMASQDGQAWDEEEDDGGPGGWFSSAKRAAQAWWRHHPAHLGVELATPILSQYASRKPAQFLAIAAVAGALIAVARPWRLISATGLLVALLKSSQVSNLVMSAMSGAGLGDKPRPRK
jgi:hypothetical protein